MGSHAGAEHSAWYAGAARIQTLVQMIVQQALTTDPFSQPLAS